MPLPTSLPDTAEDAFARVLATAASVKSNLLGVGNLLGPNPPAPVYMDNLIGLYQALAASRGVGLSIQDTEGLSEYAKAKLGPDYDINAAFAASTVACRAVTDWLLTNMPGDGQGGFIGWRSQSDGSIQRAVLDLTTLAPLATLISAALVTFS